MLNEHIDDWCAGKSPWWRVALLVFLSWQFTRHLSDAFYMSWFSALTLGLHELGHLLFQPFGEWLMVFGGSFVQIAAPIISGCLFFRQPDFFAVAVCGGWLSTSLFEMATYMADATTLQLDIVTIGGGEPVTPNDWLYLLQSVGLLHWDTRLAYVVRIEASLVMLGSLAFGGWLAWKMWKLRAA